MSHFYSKTTNSFYDPTVNAVMPEDAVEVTDEAYEALFTAQSEGKTIQADANGKPEAVDAPTPSAAALWLAHQNLAKSALSDTDVTMDRINEGVSLRLTSWTAADVVTFVSYRRTLRTILSSSTGDPTQALPTKPAYPSGT